MSAAIEYKTSIFVHCTSEIIFNDLTSRAFFGEEDAIALLTRLADSPNTLDAISSFPNIDELDERIEFFLREQLLVPVANDETQDFIPHRIDIETCRQCNARCQFCPQSVAPKSRGVMTMDLFSERGLPLLLQKEPFATDDAKARRNRGRYLRCNARLKPGVTLDQAKRDLDTIIATIRQDFPETHGKAYGVDIRPLQDFVFVSS